MMRDLVGQEGWDRIDCVAASRIATVDGSNERLPPRNMEETCSEDGTVGVEGQSRYSAKEIRMNMSFMSVISSSQERCLDLWRGDKIENPKKPTSFQKLTPSQLELYEDLTRYRWKIAQKEGCTSGMVCSLDFLGSVAWMRPVTVAGLRQIQYHLPELLDSSNPYLQGILDMCRQSRRDDGVPPVHDELSYAVYLERKANGFYDRHWLLCDTTAMVILTSVVGVAALAAVAIRNRK